MDIVGRLLGGWLAPRLGQPVLVENRPGAGGNIGTESVVRAAPDGHTLLICGPVNTLNGALYERLPFDFARDIVPVAGLVGVPLVMLVHPSVPATTVPDSSPMPGAGPARSPWPPAASARRSMSRASCSG